MKVKGEIVRILETDKNALVEISIPNYQARWLSELDKTKLYSFDIKEAKGRKTLNQNNYAWALMTDIAKELDIFPSAIDVYLTVLKMAKLKTHFIQILDSEPDEKGDTPLLMLQRAYRVVRVVDSYVNDKGNKSFTVEISEGMSRFNKNEMALFIDKLLSFAGMYGIDTSGYYFER